MPGTPGAKERTSPADIDSSWSARVLWRGGQESNVHVRGLDFSIGRQASFAENDARPSAVEYLLGALGGDLVNGFHNQATRRGITIEGMEASVNGRLGNPLVILEVVGAEGSPGLERISATLYVTSDADESALKDAWRDTLKLSPLVNTLKRSTELTVSIKVTS
jgi:uncharacterized OsmC-like protein